MNAPEHNRFRFQIDFSLNRLDALVKRIFKKGPSRRSVGGARKLNSAEGASILSTAIQNGTPFAAGRVGAIELLGLNHACKMKLGLSPGFEDSLVRRLFLQPGIFPEDSETAMRFAEDMFDILPKVDVLGHLGHLDYVKRTFAPSAKIADLHFLEPYYQSDPWSRSLKGKRVLVIHPFSESIKTQYNKRNLLFTDPDILPDFELLTYKPVQSFANERPPFQTWFDALDHMHGEIASFEFDVALIGAGAYGLPLATRIKENGQVAIHMGGATQILFGIRGRRWDNHPFISKLFNEHWVRPLSEETPKDSQLVENGCYW